LGVHEKNACDKPGPEVGGFLSFEVASEKEKGDG
jgi:hypothetical protein